jgi:hypothetical protein
MCRTAAMCMRKLPRAIRKLTWVQFVPPTDVAEQPRSGMAVCATISLAGARVSLPVVHKDR